MAEFAGSALYLKFGSVALSADHRAFSTSETQETIDATAGSDTYEQTIPRFTTATGHATLVAQTAGSVLWAAIAPGTQGTLEWGPEGTAAGKQKFTAGTATVTTRNRDFPYDNVVTIDIDWKLGTVSGG